MTSARTIAFNLNGAHVRAVVRPHHTLIEVLQAQFSLTGARESCGQGLCGCCTVVINDRPVSGCLYLAALVDGAKVTTIEGLETPNALSPVQQAFIEASAFQCGYCTPGFVNAATVLIEQLTRAPIPREDVEDTVATALESHICRCSGYVRYFEAVRDLVLATPGLTQAV